MVRSCVQKIRWSITGSCAFTSRSRPYGIMDWAHDAEGRIGNCGKNDAQRAIRVSEQRVTIHTDGACSGNPGPGGWGAILTYGEHEKELKGGEPHTTNNRMELMAAIAALEALKRPCTVELHTDSKYVHDGISKWIHGWKRNGWKTADKKPVKNVDLWKRLDAALGEHDVRWQWVKGHAEQEMNERADRLAVAAIAAVRAGKK